MCRYWAEVVNRPVFNKNGRPIRWELSAEGAPEKLVVPPMFAFVQRLVPHLLGWFPYAVRTTSTALGQLISNPFPSRLTERVVSCSQVIWITLLHSFFMNIYQPEGSEAPGPPSWVWVAVIGQCVVFSSFAVTQFLLLFFDSGPKFYIYGELSYLILSLVAKGVLGLILISNVFIFESLDEARCPLYTSLYPFGIPFYQTPCVRFAVSRPLR